MLTSMTTLHFHQKLEIKQEPNPWAVDEEEDDANITLRDEEANASEVVVVHRSNEIFKGTFIP